MLPVKFLRAVRSTLWVIPVSLAIGAALTVWLHPPSFYAAWVPVLVFLTILSDMGQDEGGSLFVTLLVMCIAAIPVAILLNVFGIHV